MWCKTTLLETRHIGLARRETSVTRDENRANCDILFSASSTKVEKRNTRPVLNSQALLSTVKVVTSKKTWRVVFGMFIEVSFQNMNLTAEGETASHSLRKELGKSVKISDLFIYICGFL